RRGHSRHARRPGRRGREGRLAGERAAPGGAGGRPHRPDPAAGQGRYRPVHADRHASDPRRHLPEPDRSRAMTTAAVALPSTVSNGLSRGRIEILQFLRDRTAVIFTFAFPAMLLLLFGTIFGDSYDNTGVSASQVYSASMIAYGILSTAFVTMGSGVALDREDGTLKRLHGTPITPTAYVMGKLILVLVLSVAEAALLILVGVLVFDMPSPDAAHWLTFAWLFLLSTFACTACGIAVSAIVKHARTAGAILNVPVVFLQFISGVFIHPITVLPTWLITVASF